ncbi:M56 family metallopeptidase [Sporosarcina limicola]|uniref:Beta-lactamase regulating signal transducer with metallopeptidase domain n=1 Tax=Sporosarcina limicola TaxID=34101 RepID=A0A927RFY2_9BACL|nr:M56 family metallopeptidase [Sporosarcina limicola]MBE1555992.1 beta-lactamase regulating signal transducer with metallopeptidase domain [Sporosarcina limicola]
MNILQMSGSAGLLILIIVVVRLLTLNKLPKKTFIVLWGIVICKLMIPVSISSQFSVYNLFQKTTSAVYLPLKALPVSIPNGITTAPSITEQSSVMNKFMDSSPIEICWAIGTLLLTTFFVIAFYKSYQQLRTALPITNNPIINEWLSKQKLYRNLRVMVSDQTATPLAYGFLRPKIILPKSMDFTNSQQMNYILTHEFVHIKHFDTLWKFTMIVSLCFHWFNPMVWVMFVLMNRDLELACDEKVIKMYGETIKPAYALSLINMADKKSKFNPLSNGFSKNSIEERIVSIMKMKKTTLLNIALAFAFVIGTTAIFATTADATRKNAEPNMITGSEFVDTDVNELIMMSTIDQKTKKIMISIDGGNNWITEEEFEKAYPSPKVEWYTYTYDEYKSWLELEKKSLQEIVDSSEKGWSPSTGWFVWTQEIANEAISRYEQTLEDIKNGTLLSKSGDGNVIVTNQSHGVSIDSNEEEVIEFGPYDTEVKATRITQQEADSVYLQSVSSAIEKKDY